MIKIPPHSYALKIICLSILLAFGTHSFSQTKPKITKEERKAMLRDRLDGKFDASVMIDNTKGLSVTSTISQKN